MNESVIAVVLFAGIAAWFYILWLKSDVKFFRNLCDAKEITIGRLYESRDQAERSARAAEEDFNRLNENLKLTRKERDACRLELAAERGRAMFDGQAASNTFTVWAKKCEGLVESFEFVKQERDNLANELEYEESRADRLVRAITEAGYDIRYRDSCELVKRAPEKKSKKK